MPAPLKFFPPTRTDGRFCERCVYDRGEHTCENRIDPLQLDDQAFNQLADATYGKLIKAVQEGAD